MLINAVCLPINDLLIWFKKKKKSCIILLIWYVQADESDLQLIVLSLRLDIIISARIFYICHTSISNRTLANGSHEKKKWRRASQREAWRISAVPFFFFFPTRAKYQEIVRAHLWNVGGSWSTWRDTRGGRGRAYSQTFGLAYLGSSEKSGMSQH